MDIVKLAQNIVTLRASIAADQQKLSGLEKQLMSDCIGVAPAVVASAETIAPARKRRQVKARAKARQTTGASVRKQILTQLSAGQKPTTELVKAIGKTRNHVGVVLNQMLKKGEISRVESGVYKLAS